MENQNSGVNTVLIVVILLIVVGFVVWMFTDRNEVPAPAETPQNDNTLDIRVDIPEMNDDDTNPEPAPEEN